VSIDVLRRPCRSVNVCPNSAHIPWTLGRCIGDGLGDQGRHRDPFGAKRTVGTYPSPRRALKAANRAEGRAVDGT
jgi:hypothetical protein